MAGREGAENLWLAWVGNVEDRCPLRPVLMADIGIISVDDDLSPARKLHPAQMADVRRCARRSAAIAFCARQYFVHVVPPIETAPAVAGGDAIKKGRIRIALSHASPPFYLTIVPFPTVANLRLTEKICQENFRGIPVR
jgi:hypothetical protein